ncbi:MAG: pyridoxal phosphate-dependent aminotransferase [Aerococcus sp.]|nr:pyridoxal phosphate-dependent aminotransferase [Aerococcus sp.]
MKLSKRIQNLAESKTLQSSDRARQLKAQGIDVISLTVGEPDFSTPDYIRTVAKQAIDQGVGDHYTPAAGAKDVRQGIRDYVERHNHVNYVPEEVFVANGAKAVLYDLLQVLIDPGDEVLIPEPYWVSYAEQVRLAGGIPKLIPLDPQTGFKLTTKALSKALSDKTALLILNYPNNPTGTVLTETELQAIGDFCVEHDLLILADEIYNELVYETLPNGFSIASISDAIKQQTIVVSGVSKTYAMTGWRIGYCLADKAIIKALSKFAGQVSGNPAGISQYATLGAVSVDDPSVTAMREAFKKRRDLGYEAIRTLPGFELDVKPAGAFYFFPRCQKAAELTGYETVDDFALALLEEAHVATVVGSAFGLPEYLRLSYATSEEQFAEGMVRIRHFIETKMAERAESE